MFQSYVPPYLVQKKALSNGVAALLESLLKDIRAERPKITEKDNLRLLYVTKWFLEFFQAQRAQEPDAPLAYGLVAEVTDRQWIVWVLKRMRGAVEDKVSTLGSVSVDVY